MTSHRIEFPGTEFPAVELPDLASLSLNLHVQNSPLLFGCRSGLCGTCLIEVESIHGEPLDAPDRDEREALRLYAPGNAKARLACQLRVTASMKVRKIQSA